MGYIGYYLWIDKGIKALMPNGRNPDGSINNYLFETDGIYTTSFNFEDTYCQVAIIKEGNFISSKMGYYITQDGYLNPRSTTVFPKTACVFASVMVRSGGIISLIPKEAYRTADEYNTRPDYMTWASMPSSQYINLTLGASNSTYRAPESGYFAFSKKTTKVGEYTVLLNNTAGFSIGYSSASIGTLNEIFIPASKNDQIKVSYTASGELQYFKFIYCNGSVPL